MVVSNERLDMEELGSLYKQSKAVQGSTAKCATQQDEEGDEGGTLPIDLD